MAPVFKAKRKLDGPGVVYQSGDIDRICNEHNLPRPFEGDPGFLARDHACLLEDPMQPCSTAQFNTCTDGTLESACAANGIAIFARIAPYEGYYINEKQYWCKGTEIED
jgi:hypothetical protein